VSDWTEKNDYWKNRAKSSEHNFGIEHDEVKRLTKENAELKGALKTKTYLKEVTVCLSARIQRIEGRYYSWIDLSEQQEEDISWLIRTLREKLSASNDVKST